MRQRGFTLIELLVVIVLMGAVMALVGPLGTEQIARTERISEIRSLESMFKFQARQAFLTGSAYELVLSGKSISVKNLNNSKYHQVDFEHLFFNPEKIYLSMNGVYSQPDVKYYVAGKLKQVTLSAADNIQ